MSAYTPEALFSEARDWDLFDVNARLGPSGVHGELALETTGLLREMSRGEVPSALDRRRIRRAPRQRSSRAGPHHRTYSGVVCHA